MMSPKLFSEFLTERECGILVDDDILTYIIYADDLILCSDSPEGLQKLIDGLFEFCKKWQRQMYLFLGKRYPIVNSYLIGQKLRLPLSTNMLVL